MIQVGWAMIYHFEKLGFSVVARPRGFSVDYDIYSHEGRDEHGFLFHKKGSDDYPDPVSDILKADIFVRGSVKWDGCSNWYFDEQDRNMIHGCCKEDIVRLGSILGECWELTKMLCHNWFEDNSSKSGGRK